MIKYLNKYTIPFLAFFFLPMFNFAQEASTSSNSSYLSNALFNTLLVLIILFLIVIIVLGQALRNMMENDEMKQKFRTRDDATNSNEGLSKKALMLFLILGAYQMNAATPKGSGSWLVGGLDMYTFYSMLAIILVEACIIGILYSTIMRFVGAEKKAVAQKKTVTKNILEKLNASVDIEQEHDILLDHDYDGIKELDNDLPPWWKYGFYLTILIAVVYLINYHVAGTGDLQKVEYEKSMAAAKLEVEEYMKTAASNVDETTIKQLSGADIETGKDVFITNCAACHGKAGQGGVGPNLTDNYWLHGGGIADIFKSIKYGWLDKGMKSWKEDLSPMQIAQISSFIRTLKGTNPEGAKAPQGDVYTEAAVAASDSTKVITDSLTVKPDTLSTTK